MDAPPEDDPYGQVMDFVWLGMLAGLVLALAAAGLCVVLKAVTTAAV